jgi:predicted alpha/beta superfamily hydrolase
MQLACALLAASCAAAQVTGTLATHQLDSRIFGNQRTVRVWLPAGYSPGEARGYPVLLLNDGQNLFDRATSVFTGREWQADETATRLIAERKIPPLIVVGVDNAGRSGRPMEYLPWEDKFLSPPVPNPRGSLYPSFLADEVLPLITATYRVDKRRIALGGSSYGALIALYAAAIRPELISGLLLESPSLYVAERKVLDVVRKAKSMPARIYLGVGTNEMGAAGCRPGDRGSEAVRDVLDLARLLPRAKLVIEDCAVHDEDAWARRLPAALLHLFGTP